MLQALLVLLVVLQLLSAAAAATSYPDVQHLNVREVLAGTKALPPKINGYHDFFNKHEASESASEGEGKYKLRLLHRDKLRSASSHQDSHSHRFHDQMKRDVKRVAGPFRRLSGDEAVGPDGGAAHEVVEDVGSDVVSGMDRGSRDDFASIGVGSSARSQYMVIESGSNIVWVSCGSTVCDRLEKAGCRSGGATTRCPTAMIPTPRTSAKCWPLPTLQGRYSCNSKCMQ